MNKVIVMKEETYDILTNLKDTFEKDIFEKTGTKATVTYNDVMVWLLTTAEKYADVELKR